jgi:hypothetical protein
MAGAEAAARLLDLLDQEGMALRQGDFARLRTLLPEKESVCADLAAIAEADSGTLRRIAWLSGRNEALLTAARGGLQAALERLGAVARAREGLRTYDRSGSSTLVGQNCAGPIRRA